MVPAGVLVVGAVVSVRLDAPLAEVSPHGRALLGSVWFGRGLGEGEVGSLAGVVAGGEVGEAMGF